MEENDRSCRICFDTSDAWSNRLVDVCLCRGSMKYIHVLCVKSGLTYGHTSCGVCGTEYTVENLTKTRVAEYRRRLDEATAANGGTYRYDESKFRHAGQCVSASKPSVESAVLVLEDDRFRRALAAAYQSFLAGPVSVSPRQLHAGLPVIRKPAYLDDFRIVLRNLDGRSAVAYVRPAESIGAFRLWYSKRIGFCADQLRLVYQGGPMNYGQTFAEYGIKPDAVIHVVLQITGS